MKFIVNAWDGCPANAYILHNDYNFAEDSWCSAKLKIKKYINDYLTKNGMKEEYERRKSENQLCKK